MEQTKEHKERNKGGRPKKEATEKLKYRIAVKMTAADYFRLLTRSHEAGVSPSEYMRECFDDGISSVLIPSFFLSPLTSNFP